MRTIHYDFRFTILDLQLLLLNVRGCNDNACRCDDLSALYLDGSNDASSTTDGYKKKTPLLQQAAKIMIEGTSLKGVSGGFLLSFLM